MANDFVLKVLVVDDSIFYRKIISDALSELPEVSVVGSAANGRIAVHRIKTLKPDLLTLDIEMPEMNGIEVLEWMQENAPDVGAIVLSSFTKKGSRMTVNALQHGAFDFIEKADSGNMEENIKIIREMIRPMLKAFARRQEIRNVLNRKTNDKAIRIKDLDRKDGGVVQRMRKISGQMRRKSSIVVIGISTGGPEALAKMLPVIPANINVPILIVQHMPAAFTESITDNLNTRCAIEVRPAANGELLKPNIAYFAPGGKQMKITTGMDGKTAVIRITDDLPENNCKPSADYLFRSVAHQYKDRATGVIMTGMGSDGTLGLKLMKRNSAFIITQDEETCTVFGMPREPIEAGIVDVIAPLDRIAEEIIRSVK